MITYRAKEFISENKAYHLFYCAESRSLHLHTHDFYEIAYVYEGMGKHYANGKIGMLTEGDFILLSPGIEHCVASLEESNAPWIRICNCLFAKEYFENLVQSYLKFDALKNTEFYNILQNKVPFCLHLSDNKDHIIKNYIWSIKYEYDLDKNCIDSVVKNLLINFLVETSRIYDLKLGRTAPAAKQNLEIENLIKYMKANLNTNLTLELLAAQIYFSPEYLSRYFKKITGKNISTYLMELRIAKAKELLCSSSYSITEVCHLCGYSSISNFRKYFSKTVGMSPREYRKLNRKI